MGNRLSIACRVAFCTSTGSALSPPSSAGSQAAARPELAREASPRASSSASAPRQPLEQPVYVNPHLGAITAAGTKQYTYRGTPLFEPYPHGGDKPSQATPRREIGSGFFHTVQAKRNPHAPFHRKVAHERNYRTELPGVLGDIDRLDRLAQVLLAPDDETRRMSEHFALELLKEVRDGQPVFYTRKIDGFTLEAYLADPASHPELPLQDLPRLGRELVHAIDWLHGKGFFHDDLHDGNVMYDRQRRKLVLIDMDSPGETDTESSQRRFAAARAWLEGALVHSHE
jgi:hypothetical protein